MYIYKIKSNLVNLLKCHAINLRYLTVHCQLSGLHERCLFKNFEKKSKLSKLFGENLIATMLSLNVNYYSIYSQEYNLSAIFTRKINSLEIKNASKTLVI